MLSITFAVRSLVITILLIVLTGCFSVYKQRGVDSSDPTKMAVIETAPCKGHDCLLIKMVDGKWRGVGWITRYELKPGIRTLRLSFMGGDSRRLGGYLFDSRDHILEFEALAGHTYGVLMNVNHPNSDDQTATWLPQVIDSATQQVVSKEIATARAF